MRRRGWGVRGRMGGGDERWGQYLSESNRFSLAVKDFVLSNNFFSCSSRDGSLLDSNISRGTSGLEEPATVSLSHWEDGLSSWCPARLLFSQQSVLLHGCCGVPSGPSICVSLAVCLPPLAMSIGSP